MAQAARAGPRRHRDRDLAPGRDGAAHGPDPGAVQDIAAPPQHRHDPREPAARRLAHRLGARRDVRDRRARAQRATPTRRRPALDFFLNADAGRYPSYLGNVAYRISTVRYYGDGAGGGRLLGRSRRRNIEIDGWGLFLWAARDVRRRERRHRVAVVDDEEGRHGLRRDQDRRRRAARSRTSRPSGMAIADASNLGGPLGQPPALPLHDRDAPRAACATWRRSRAAPARSTTSTRYRMLAEKAATAMKANFVDSQPRARRLARAARAAARTTATARRVEAITWSLIARERHRSRPRRSARCRICRRPPAATSASRARSDQYDTDEWILIDLRASAAFRRAGQRRRRPTSCSSWVTGAGVGELRPVARAVQHAQRRAVRSARTRARSRWSATARARTS